MRTLYIYEAHPGSVDSSNRPYIDGDYRNCVHKGNLKICDEGSIITAEFQFNNRSHADKIFSDLPKLYQSYIEREPLILSIKKDADPAIVKAFITLVTQGYYCTTEKCDFPHEKTTLYEKSSKGRSALNLALEKITARIGNSNSSEIEKLNLKFDELKRLIQAFAKESLGHELVLPALPQPLPLTNTSTSVPSQKPVASTWKFW